jgi:hypothetical protein
MFKAKRVSALLTLLLAALLAASPFGSNGGSTQSAPAAVVLADLAQGTPSLSGAQSARDAESRQADDDTDAGDAAPLTEFVARTPIRAGGSTRLSNAAVTAPCFARGYQARAPPTV